MKLSLFLPAAISAGLFVAAPVWANPADIVPRGHIAYDLLGSFAGAGRLPGMTLADFFRGDRLYTRAEMAAFVATLTIQTGDENERWAAMERLLRAEFAPELAQLGKSEYANSGRPARLPGYTGEAKARLLTSPGAGTGTYRVSGVLPFGRDGFAAVLASNYRDEWYTTRRLGAGRGGYPTIETAYARQNGRVFDVTLGRLPLRLGPGYEGGLLVSDEARTPLQARVEKTFRLPGSLKRAGVFGFMQVYGQFWEDEEPTADPEARGTRKHLAVRRLETAGTGRFQVALTEAYKSTRLPDFVWSQVLPFYQYQNDWTKESKHRTLNFLVTDPIQSTRWLNYLGDANVVYRTGKRGLLLYADLLLDDVKAPRGIGQNTVTARKVGQQYGVYAPNLDGANRVGARLEVTSLDPLTYTNISAPITWSNDGLPLGHPAGPNALSVFGRVDARFNPRVRVALEGTARRRRTSNPAAPQPTTGERAGLYATYNLAPNTFTGFRIEHERVTPFGGSRRNNTRVELNFGAGL